MNHLGSFHIAHRDLIIILIRLSPSSPFYIVSFFQCTWSMKFLISAPFYILNRSALKTRGELLGNKIKPVNKKFIKILGKLKLIFLVCALHRSKVCVVSSLIIHLNTPHPNLTVSSKCLPPPFCLRRLHESVIALKIIIISARKICIREIKKLFPLLPNET